MAFQMMPSLIAAETTRCILSVASIQVNALRRCIVKVPERQAPPSNRRPALTVFTNPNPSPAAWRGTGSKRLLAPSLTVV